MQHRSRWSRSSSNRDLRVLVKRSPDLRHQHYSCLCFANAALPSNHYSYVRQPPQPYQDQVHCCASSPRVAANERGHPSWLLRSNHKIRTWSAYLSGDCIWLHSTASLCWASAVVDFDSCECKQANWSTFKTQSWIQICWSLKGVDWHNDVAWDFWRQLGPILPWADI